MRYADAGMRTEEIDPRHAGLDSWDTSDMLTAMYEGQLAAAASVQPALAGIARAVDDATPALKRGGRIVYVGAGTSGRIGVQDGIELTPTFNWPANRAVFLLAGGMAALTRSVEGAEDSEGDGARAVAEARVGPIDVVIGITASGTTPYTIGALRAANAAGAVTIGVASNPDVPLFNIVRHPVLIRTGSEVIAGSTRMKAGTAQKIVLNLLSTALMVRLGRVYRGLMVDMRASNAKLERRAEAIVSRLTGCAPEDAARGLAEAKGDLKIAVLLVLGTSAAAAAKLLERHDGHLRGAIGEIRSGND